jgi:hypothetical protein
MLQAEAAALHEEIKIKLMISAKAWSVSGHAFFLKVPKEKFLSFRRNGWFVAEIYLQ